MRVHEILDISVILPGYSTREPSLRDLILHYYQTAGGGICADQAVQYTQTYIEQLESVELECFGV